MNQEEMTRIVKEELKHIPSGDGVMHGWLRTYYNRWRRQDLKNGKTKEETMTRCIEALRQENPSYLAEYDITFLKFNSS